MWRCRFWWHRWSRWGTPVFRRAKGVYEYEEVCRRWCQRCNLRQEKVVGSFSDYSQETDKLIRHQHQQRRTDV